MKTRHAPTVRGQPRVFQQLEGGAAIASRERHAWVGAMVDFLPSSSSGESLRVPAGCRDHRRATVSKLRNSACRERHLHWRSVASETC